MEKTIVEVRSVTNDNVVVQFEHTVTDTPTNAITAGFSKICGILGINRVQAENHYYVTKG